MAARLNFRQIEVFRAFMLTGTTVAAANMLNTIQPSVSRSLAQIQAASNLKLFELDRSRLRPTPEAAKLFEAIQRNFLGLEAIALLRRSGTGRLRIACTPAQVTKDLFGNSDIVLNDVQQCLIINARRDQLHRRNAPMANRKCQLR